MLVLFFLTFFVCLHIVYSVFINFCTRLIALCVVACCACFCACSNWFICIFVTHVVCLLLRSLHSLSIVFFCISLHVVLFFFFFVCVFCGVFVTVDDFFVFWHDCLCFAV